MEQTTSPSTSSFWLRDILFIILVFVGVYCSMLGIRQLGFPDDAVSAEIAREMVSRPDWLTPHLNGAKYLNQPPLYFWLQATTIKLFGVSALGLRLMSALFAVVGCLSTYIIGRQLFGRRAGLIAAFILGSSGLYFIYAQTIAVYLVGSVLFSTSLFCYLAAAFATSTKRHHLLITGFWGSAALTWLSLGPLGLILPLLLGILWNSWCRQWETLKATFYPPAVLLFFVLLVPWYAYVTSSNPDFLTYLWNDVYWPALVTYFSPPYNIHFTILAGLFFGLLPWSAFLINSLWLSHKPSERYPAIQQLNRFLLLWAISIPLLLLFTNTHQLPWLLLAFPPFALIIGRYLAAAWEQEPQRLMHQAYLLLLFVMLLIVAGLLLWAYWRTLPAPTHGLPYVKLMAVVLLACTLLAIPLIHYRKVPTAIVTLTIAALISLMTLSFCYRFINPQALTTLSMPVAAQPQASVFSYHQYYPQLSLLLEREIVVVEWPDQPPYSQRYERDSLGWGAQERVFWHYWLQQQRLFFVFVPRDQFAAFNQHYDEYNKENKSALFQLGSTPEVILLTNFANGIAPP